MDHTPSIEEDPPASVEVTTASGRVIDLQNCPGKVKMELILEGEMSPDAFIVPGNMPGSKLKELREAHRERVGEVIKNMGGGENKYKVGDFIEYKDENYEILKTDPEKGVMIYKGKKQVWVHHSKVTPG